MLFFAPHLTAAKSAIRKVATYYKQSTLLLFAETQYPAVMNSPDNAGHFDCLWINARIMTFADDAAATIPQGAIGSINDTIAWVGNQSDLTEPADKLAGRVIDCQNRWILPGFIDCHTHLVFAGNRVSEFEAGLEGVSYSDIASQGGGIMSTVRATREATEDDLLAASSARARQLLRDGVTTLEIKSGYGLELATEARMLRVARRIGEALPVTVVTTFLGAHAIPSEFADNRGAYLDAVCEQMLPNLANEGLIDAVDAFCESIAFSSAEVERVFTAARALGLPVKLHAEQLSDSGGAALAASYGALSADHLEYLNSAGARAMAKSGTVAVLLPGAYYSLGETRRPPVDLLRNHNIPIAVATDCNPGSSAVLSLRLMANMACRLFGLTVPEALCAITVNAARALGMSAQIGSLEPGKQADFVVWDIEEPAELIYWLGAGPPDQVVQRGQVQNSR